METIVTVPVVSINQKRNQSPNISKIPDDELNVPKKLKVEAIGDTSDGDSQKSPTSSQETSASHKDGIHHVKLPPLASDPQQTMKPQSNIVLPSPMSLFVDLVNAKYARENTPLYYIITEIPPEENKCLENPWDGKCTFKHMKTDWDTSFYSILSLSPSGGAERFACCEKCKDRVLTAFKIHNKRKRLSMIILEQSIITFYTYHSTPKADLYLLYNDAGFRKRNFIVGRGVDMEKDIDK